MKQPPSIVATNITVKKADQTILDSLSFTIQAGKITGLVGPSGSGKTTLMRTLVGVQKLSRGTLMIFEKPAGDKRLRTRVGYVTQSPAVYSDLTVWQNLRYFATLANANAPQIESIMHTVHLESKKRQLVEKLSGGERARVSLAIALLGDPDVIVMDEPTVGLDPILRQELWQLFHKLAQEGKTLLISSHVMDEAERCDQLLLMREGRLLWSNSKEALLAATKTRTVEAAFIAAINNPKGGQ